MAERRGFLVDTNVISETSRARPNAQVARFVQRHARDFYLSVLTIGEMQKGLEKARRRDDPQADSLAQWLSSVQSVYADRILDIDREVALRWGEISADRSRPVIDTILAATALVHGLTVVTRNQKDFVDLDVPLINPWN